MQHRRLGLPRDKEKVPLEGLRIFYPQSGRTERLLEHRGVFQMKRVIVASYVVATIVDVPRDALGKWSETAVSPVAAR